MTLAAPRICCLDLDTFFVSVERLLDPSLVGKPVVVGGLPGQRGVVTAASYEVRELGVRSGMSLTEAARLAPSAVYLPTRFGIYDDYAARVRRIAESFTPVSQVASIDEMFLDFSGCERLYRAPGDTCADHTIERTVRRMTDEIQARVGLPSSAGIASRSAPPNTVAAKILDDTIASLCRADLSGPPRVGRTSQVRRDAGPKRPGLRMWFLCNSYQSPADVLAAVEARNRSGRLLETVDDLLAVADRAVLHPAGQLLDRDLYIEPCVDRLQLGLRELQLGIA